MIKSKNELKEYLDADKKSLKIDSHVKFMSLRYRIWKYEVLMRKLEYMTNTKKLYKYNVIYWLRKIRFQQLSIKYGYELHLNTIGKGLCLAHIGPIIINGATKIGDNCRIHVGVNIGTSAGLDDASPIIGNNVYIGPGAKIFGKIIIADGIVIGANSVVNKSFLEKEISIAGVPAKKIGQHGREYIETLKNKMIK